MKIYSFSSQPPLSRKNTYIVTVNGQKVRVRATFDALLSMLPVIMAARCRKENSERRTA